MNGSIFSILDEIIKEIEANGYSDTQNVVLVPPSNDLFASDKEECDDDIGLSGNINLPVDVSGIVKIHSDGSDDTDVSNNNDLDEPYLKANKRKWKGGTKIFDINFTW